MVALSRPAGWGGPWLEGEDAAEGARCWPRVPWQGQRKAEHARLSQACRQEVYGQEDSGDSADNGCRQATARWRAEGGSRQGGSGSMAARQRQQAATAGSGGRQQWQCHPPGLSRLPRRVPGMMRPATLLSSSLVRTSTGSTPGMRRSSVMCSRKLPCSASTPTRIAAGILPGSATMLAVAGSTAAKGQACKSLCTATGDARRLCQMMPCTMGCETF